MTKHIRRPLRFRPALLLCLLLLLTLCACALFGCEKGDKGDQGEQGVSIIKTELIGGELIVTYSDGRKENLGAIPGESDPNVSALDFYPLPDGSYGVKAGNIDYIRSITVPASYKGRPVSRILTSAFKGCANLQQVTLPQSLTSIDEGAFLDCSSLRSLVIPEGVTQVGNFALQRCVSLTTVTLPSTLVSIEQTAFLDCVRLVEVINHSTLPLTPGSSDGGYAAQNALEVHSGPESRLETVGDFLFYSVMGDHRLIAYLGNEESPVLPQEYKNGSYALNGHAFDGYYKLTSIELPDAVTAVGERAFANCTSLTSVKLPEDLLSIGAGAFAGCEKLVITNLPKNLTALGESAFDGTAFFNDPASWSDQVLYLDGYLIRARDTLSGKYEIPAGTALIADGAFSSCIELTELKLPLSIASVGVRSFGHCRALDRIVFAGTKAQWEALPKGEQWSYEMGYHTVVCTDGSVTPPILG